MDVLIDLIVFLIKQASKASEKRAPVTVKRPVPTSQAPAQQIQAMQKAMAVQAARTRPAPTQASRGPASWAQPGVRSAVAPVNQPPVPPIGPDPDAISRPKPPPTSIPGLKLPFLLGEVLSSPAAFREDLHGGFCDP